MSLGFHIAWKKCSSPSTTTLYLGILFDSIGMQLSLPTRKLLKLHSELSFFTGKSRATTNQLQQLCGVLAHCSKVICGGRTFSRRIIYLLSGLPEGNPRITLTKDFHLDIEWWCRFAEKFNGVASLIKYNFGLGPTFFTDSTFTGYCVKSIVTSGTRNEDPERGTRIRNEERGSGTRNEDLERGTRIRNEERGSGTGNETPYDFV